MHCSGSTTLQRRVNEWELAAFGPELNTRMAKIRILRGKIEQSISAAKAGSHR